MPFEPPSLTVLPLGGNDVITSSGEDWELPIVTEASEPKPSGWETPIIP